MALWTLRGGLAASGMSTPSSGGAITRVAVVADSAAHTKGVWTEIIATTPAEADGFWVLVGNTAQGATAHATLMDVGFSADGGSTWHTLIANMQTGYISDSSGRLWWVPLKIPSGVKVGARSQSAVASKSVSVNVTPSYRADMGTSGHCYSVCETHGINEAASRGTNPVNWGGSAGTWGSWVEVSAATANPVRAILLDWAAGNSVVTAQRIVQVGVGGSGAEVSALGDLWLEGNTAEAYYHNHGLLSLHEVSLPAGSRLCVRLMAAIDVSSNVNWPQLHTFS